MAKVASTSVYWDTFIHDDHQYFLAKTDKGLCYVGSPNKPITELEDWVHTKIKHANLEKHSEKLEEDIQKIKQYLSGNTTEFKLPLDIIGTPFQKSVWQATNQIPYGNTKTYQSIAEEIHNPKAVRAVGTAIGANPLLIIIPCHRVVAKNGGLSGFRGGLNMKEFLLTLESKKD